ncbi:nuclear transport factor 2 family protein [Aliiglaciecola sp. CAU 1673]|uniref:nuclear transport factor 2 family protein n=1 Tax=Aliiglaciecola sp. CAU 1673 TaxID=3032595 RepID=UPI0023DAC5EA|nr:nuclear transport factor 2 family protein [Aliiglaciecola sp. CAU 1673]MDF2180355.1 nuclear transport factor 2 family protein [Aliiglaciecola sp. CAU 1673]
MPAIYILIVAFTVFPALAEPVPAEENAESLTAQILALDKQLFTAFNQRNLEVMKAMLSQDLEFYHDKAGLSDYQQNLQSTINLFNSDSDLTRELLPGSTEVHPIPGYGAIQTGQHRFCHTADNGQPDCGTFKFLHIWKAQKDQWQITRVVSYDH